MDFTDADLQALRDLRDRSKTRGFRMNTTEQLLVMKAAKAADAKIAAEGRRASISSVNLAEHILKKEGYTS